MNGVGGYLAHTAVAPSYLPLGIDGYEPMF